MSTSVDICNLALSMLGDKAGVSSLNPPDGSPQAGHCSRWYPFALRKLLEAHAWSFATTRARLPKLAFVDQDLYRYMYGYVLPADCVYVVRVSSSGSSSPEDFEVETNQNGVRTVYTDAADAVIVYVRYVENMTTFPAYFTYALTLLLAAYLVGPLKRADSANTTSVNLLKQYELALSQAKTADAKSAVHRAAGDRVPFGIRARMI